MIKEYILVYAMIEVKTLAQMTKHGETSTQAHEEDIYIYKFYEHS